MNSLLAICGLVFIVNAATPNLEQASALIKSPNKELKCPSLQAPVKLVTFKPYAPEVQIVTKTRALAKEAMVYSAGIDLNDIVFLETEEIIDLGFEPADYLPENFDPNKVFVDLNKVPYLESGDEVTFNFETSQYLPKDFNPYAIPSDISSISFIEEEPALDFDPRPYLPEGFDPYEVYFDINSIEYIEVEDEVELDFSTQDYLPRGFDPYSR